LATDLLHIVLIEIKNYYILYYKDGVLLREVWVAGGVTADACLGQVSTLEFSGISIGAFPVEKDSSFET
jgi:hypothetical protein